MLPFLRFLGDRKEHSVRDVEESLSQHFKLTDAERVQLLASGQQGVFRNRIGWARTYLKKACLIEAPMRGVFKITDRGLTTLATNPARIDGKFLEQFSEFIEFRELSKTSNGIKTEDEPAGAAPVSTSTPHEAIDLAYQRLRGQLAQELLAVVLTCSPTFFEQLVVDLLVKMGYGGSRRDAGERIGQTGDGGIDGIIKEDHLGLDAIFIQAKRWQTGNSKICRRASRAACKERCVYYNVVIHWRCN